MKQVLLLVPLVFMLAGNDPVDHSNQDGPIAHGNNPTVEIAGVVFPIEPELAEYLSAVGLIGEEVSADCTEFTTWEECAAHDGAWRSHLEWCIDTYLCAYDLCMDCDGPMQSLCVDNAQYGLFGCSGLDLMSVEHTEALDILQEALATD